MCCKFKVIFMCLPFLSSKIQTFYFWNLHFRGRYMFSSDICQSVYKRRKYVVPLREVLFSITSFNICLFHFKKLITNFY
uniref:Uncharacterized protein n=1 Tax=Rhizophora mucronata TaxID=61149 RepID=A0A2P2MVP5_RHIMU